MPLPQRHFDAVKALDVSGVVFVTGKGGVGKSTVAAMLSLRAARAGQRTLLVTTDGARVVADALGLDTIVWEPATVDVDSCPLAVRSIAPDDALIEWLADHGLGRLAKRMVSTGLIDVVATATPGLRDLLVLAKIKALWRAGDYDAIVVDTPASGHAVTFLRSPHGLMTAARSGVIFRQAEEVVSMLHDHEHTSVVLVTLPEETPVSELLETAYAIEDDIGVRLGAVIVNRCNIADHVRDGGDNFDDADGIGPTQDDVLSNSTRSSTQRRALTEATAFLRTRADEQRRQVQRLAEALPLPQVLLPELEEVRIGRSELHRLETCLSTSDGTAPAVIRAQVDPVSAQRPGKKRAKPSKQTADLSRIVSAAEVVVLCGPGGVGKTTLSAAVALHAAANGRRVALITIDPARRLADTLGIANLSNHPRRVDAAENSVVSGAPATSGSVFALMLDTKATFDDLVRRYATDERQAERILTNSFYANISGSLGGTQEYMATEKLWELRNAPVDEHGDRLEPFDLLVVDTPPTRNALDFLAAPERLLRLLDNRVFRTLVTPARRSLRVLGVAAQTVLKPIGAIVGADVLADTVTFFQAFEGMEEGFRIRARDVQAMLRAPSSTWIVVTTGTSATVDEAEALLTGLQEHGIVNTTVVANRLAPSFGVSDRVEIRDAIASAVDDACRLQRRANAERDAISELAPADAIARIVARPVPLTDVASLATLLTSSRL